MKETRKGNVKGLQVLEFAAANLVWHLVCSYEHAHFN